MTALLIAATGASAAQKPDVVMIAADDLRPMLSCYGDPRIKTPHIDRLAARSVLFERAYCQLAKCGPSRLSLMTGLRPTSIQVFGHSGKELAAFRKRRPDAVSMARWFKDRGYVTRSFGKIDHDGWQLASDWSAPPFAGREREMWEIHDTENPDGRSIIADRWSCPVSQHPDVVDTHFFTGRMTEEAIDVYQNRDDSKPVFLAVGYRRPHLPFTAPKRYHDLYSPDDSWLAENLEPPADSPPMAWVNSDGYLKGALRLGVKVAENPTHEDWQSWNGFEMRSYLGVPIQGPIETGLQLELLQSYAACVSYVDSQIGKLLDAIELEKTIIVFWSDHGWHLGEHSAWGKMTNFEVATRVPLLISAPGIAPGRTRSIAELVDLYPTLCDLTGVAAPAHLQGESLLEVLKQPQQVAETVALSEYPRFQGDYHGRTIRTNRFRYVQWRKTTTGKIAERELYDHTTDPDETTNIANRKESVELMEYLDTQLHNTFVQP
ncbi:MAG: sulfatase [Verrucomicrobiota bacterium]